MNTNAIITGGGLMARMEESIKVSNEPDLSQVNPSSFYRKPKLSPKQVKARKSSKQAKKSRKTNRKK